MIDDDNHIHGFWLLNDGARTMLNPAIDKADKDKIHHTPFRKSRMNLAGHA